MEGYTSKPVVYIGSQELAKISALLPSNKKRSMIVHSLVSSLGLMNNPKASENARRLQVVSPRKASYKDLAVYHTRDYLNAVLDASNLTTDGEDQETDILVNAEFGLEDDCPRFAGLAEYVQLVGGATLTATKALQQNLADIAICWDGGRHHARKSHASGFCYVADCILAILALKRPPVQSANPTPPNTLSTVRKPRIMYLDLDLHFSDAVSEAFYSPVSFSTPQVLTLSIHHTAPGFFPASERAALSNPSSPNFDPFTLSLPLKQGASDKTYECIWPIVENIRKTFEPDFVVLQCGVDALAGDPCATFNWSLGDSPGSMGWCVQKVVNEWPGKKLLLGGGGYNSPNAARAWAYLTSIAMNKPLDLETEIPDHVGFPLYGPSFTLNVSAGNMNDHNSEEDLGTLHTRFDNIIEVLQKRLAV
ncbi:histone deacetylase complex protein [Pholiota conissans]|uniref:histone deacetylase n=1 Tax=Pholiota conissans TaxID=109636 RepID=A0A9P6CY05_9AGAR|nr:histone deacetylase complex protein [Pholiota conissans]